MACAKFSNCLPALSFHCHNSDRVSRLNAETESYHDEPELLIHSAYAASCHLMHIVLSGEHILCDMINLIVRIVWHNHDRSVPDPCVYARFNQWKQLGRGSITALCDSLPFQHLSTLPLACDRNTLFLVPLLTHHEAISTGNSMPGTSLYAS